MLQPEQMKYSTICIDREGLLNWWTTFYCIEGDDGTYKCMYLQALQWLNW